MRIVAPFVVLCLTLVAASTAEADGLDLPNTGWSDCVVAPRADRDLDGFDDGCEARLASAFAPLLVMDRWDEAPHRRPYWALRQWNYRSVRVFYALAYDVDAGYPLLGFRAHLGDAEFLVLDISNTAGDRWMVDQIFMSAHWGTPTEWLSGWYRHDRVSYADEPRGRALVWVSENKHANYPDLDACDRFGADLCPLADHLAVRSPLFDIPDISDRNLGLLSSPQRLWDKVVVGTNSEWFWSDGDDKRFCGWTVGDGLPRVDCVEVTSGYQRALRHFEMEWGPQGSAGFCNGCDRHENCLNGGLCLPDVGGGAACRQECDGHACPGGSECVMIDGASQCRPVANLSCAAYADCRDGERGGAETDVDCGGVECAACPNGRLCERHSDCVSGQCSSGTCGPAGGCLGDGNCNAASHCTGGACVADVCAQGQLYCNGTERRLCNANGSGSSLIETCAFGCAAGACQSQCSGDGQCVAAQYCAGGMCVADACPQGATYCNGAEVRQCSPNGSSSSLIQNCPQGCAGGVCVVSCSCNDGDGDGHFPTTCSDPTCGARDDCNDMQSSVYGGASEACDLVDNDCDMTIDDNQACWQPVYRFWNAAAPDPTTPRCYANSPAVPGGCPGYTLEFAGPAYFVQTTPAPGTVEFLAFDRVNGADHMIVRAGTSESASLSMPGSGWNLRGSLGYYWPNASPPPAGTYYQPPGAITPFVRDLRRYYHAGAAIHLFTNSPAEVPPAPAWTSEGVRAYVWSSRW